jgi:hypothetical protein
MKMVLSLVLISFVWKLAVAGSTLVRWPSATGFRAAGDKALKAATVIPPRTVRRSIESSP